MAAARASQAGTQHVHGRLDVLESVDNAASGFRTVTQGAVVRSHTHERARGRPVWTPVGHDGASPSPTLRPDPGGLPGEGPRRAFGIEGKGAHRHERVDRYRAQGAGGGTLQALHRPGLRARLGHRQPRAVSIRSATTNPDSAAWCVVGAKNPVRAAHATSRHSRTRPPSLSLVAIGLDSGADAQRPLLARRRGLLSKGAVRTMFVAAIEGFAEDRFEAGGGLGISAPDPELLLTGLLDQVEAQPASQLGGPLPHRIGGDAAQADTPGVVNVDAKGRPSPRPQPGVSTNTAARRVRRPCLGTTVACKNGNEGRH
jgi:hypothetical protein